MLPTKVIVFVLVIVLIFAAGFMLRDTESTRELSPEVHTHEDGSVHTH